MHDPHRDAALAALRRARATLERVIARSRDLREHVPDRRPFADQEILDAETELAVIDAHISVLEAGGTLDDVTTPEDRSTWTSDSLRRSRQRLGAVSVGPNRAAGDGRGRHVAAGERRPN